MSRGAGRHLPWRGLRSLPDAEQKIREKGCAPNPPPGYFPGALIDLPFFLATEGEAEWERRIGGPIAQNISHTYALTAAEKAYLASLGVDADPLLVVMNARRNIVAPIESRNYLEHFADFSGLIKHPVLTVHAAVDQAMPVTNQSAYRNTVAAAGRDDLLFQVYTTGIGHGACTNTGQQVQAIQAIEAWAKTGIPPLAIGLSGWARLHPGLRPARLASALRAGLAVGGGKASVVIVQRTPPAAPAGVRSLTAQSRTPRIPAGGRDEFKRRIAPLRRHRRGEARIATEARDSLPGP